MPQYGISVDLSPLLAANQALLDDIMRGAAQVVRAVTEEGAYRWKDAISKSRLWSAEKAAYIDSIQWKADGLTGEVWSTYKLAGEIEDGRPAKDLKRMLQTSKKTRVAKSGAHAGMKYLIIPFRHNTPTQSGEGAHAPQMPSSIYSLARNMEPSRVTGTGTRLSGSGHVVPQQKYQWGGRLPAGLAPKLQPHHHSDPYAGMVRFDTTTPGRNGKPPTRSSSYLTFRVMGEWSSGWITRPKAGLNLVKDVAGQLQPILNDAMGQVTLKMLRR